MLSVFKDLSVHGTASKLDQFIDAVSARLASGWTRYLEGERRLKEMALSSDEPQFAFACAAAGDRPAAGLFLMRRAGGFEVTNIVPQESGSLTKAQYNAILDDFADRNARPAADALGLMVEITADRQPITHWISPEAARCLERFSRAANKGTGSSHPLDFRRWAAFLILAHRESAELDTEILRRWLVEEEGWSEDKAADLAIEYEFARSLLDAYDGSSE